MKKTKFNSNYIYNTKHNMQKIRNIVNKIMDEDINPQTLDFLFRYNIRLYPLTSHEEMNLPGEHEEIKDTAVLFMDQNAKQIDFVETIKPDGKMVKRNAVNTVEQETGILKPSKIDDIFIYNLYSTITHKRPNYITVVTNHDYKVEYKDYEVEGIPIRIYFRIYNKEKIYKLLNRLKKKDYSKEELTKKDYIRIILCLVFAEKDFVKEIIQELTCIFATMEKIEPTQQIDLHLALKMIIKFRYQDDLNKKKELITMITKSIHESKHDELNGYEVKQKSLMELKEENAKLKQENAELKQQQRVIEKLQDILEKHNIAY